MFGGLQIERKDLALRGAKVSIGSHYQCHRTKEGKNKNTSIAKVVIPKTWLARWCENRLGRARASFFLPSCSSLSLGKRGVREKSDG